MKIKIEINLGNDAMKDHLDVAELLFQLGNQVGRNGIFDRKLLDKNGNTVGTVTKEGE